MAGFRATDPKHFAGLIAVTLICAVFATGAHGQSRSGESQEVKDPHYGEVLFHFYQRQYFTSITSLMTAQQFQRIRHHGDEAELLLGGMYLSYGLHSQAAEIFQRLIDTGAPPEIRDRAWFYLAKLRYQRGYLDEAGDAMARIRQSLPGELEEERKLLQASLLMARRDYREAAEILTRMRGKSAWAVYGRYNLGVALIKAGESDSGMSFLEQVGREPANDGEIKSLKDKANVALGYALLRDGAPARALSYLEQVRLNGLLSNMALLGVGWAQSAQARHQESLVPWTELQKRVVVDPAVQESLLAVPYALTRLGAFRQALEQYENAMTVFTSEMSRIDASVVAIRSGKMVEGILRHDPASEMGWFWRMREIPDAPESRYLVHLMAGHDFQEALKNYRDLRFLSYNLEYWSNNIAIYSDMLATRRMGYEEQLPKVLQSPHAQNIAGLQSQRNRLAGELARVERDNDVMALANEKERLLLERLKRLETNLDRAAGHGETSGARDKHRLFRGLLLWDISSDYHPRLWQAKKDLANLDQGLAEIRTRNETIRRAQREAPRMFENFSARIARLRSQIPKLQSEVVAMSSAHGHYLEELAVAELLAQKQRLAAYLTQARFAVAQMYDASASTGQEAK